jgi:hypothetical protein
MYEACRLCVLIFDSKLHIVRALRGDISWFFWVAALPYDHRGEIHFGVADPTVHMSDGLFVGGSE